VQDGDEQGRQEESAGVGQQSGGAPLPPGSRPIPGWGDWRNPDQVARWVAAIVIR
jgi:hypothetical protein